jgi:DNA-binding transcriptional regulator YiaG
MPDVLEARSAYEQAQKDAIALRASARLRLGRASLRERTELHHSQQDVADTLGVVVEQVRRWETEWRKWQEAHPGQEP